MMRSEVAGQRSVLTGRGVAVAVAVAVVTGRPGEAAGAGEV